MQFALVIVSADQKTLNTAHIAHISALLSDLAVPEDDSAPPIWLAPHKAAELTLLDQLNPDQLDRLRIYTDAQEFDIFCIAKDGRKKSLLLADMDSTIVKGETLDEIAYEAGIGAQVAKITARAMNGELDFHQALNERVTLLKGQPANLLDKVLRKTQLSNGAENLIKTMGKYGATCVLVSGGFTFYTSAIARQCGFAFDHGNILDIDDGKILGSVSPPILDKHSKKQLLEDYTNKLKLSPIDSISVGDGANDLDMLKTSGIGIGYYPKPSLQKELTYFIKYSDLTSLLYIQGYHQKQHVL